MDITPFLNLLPDNIALIVAGLIIACKLVTVAVRPPSAGSRWQLPYRTISMAALNIGWATNRFQAGRSSHDTTPPKA